MNLTPAQLEQVVREVVARLATLPAERMATPSEPQRALLDKPAVAPGMAAINERVITLNLVAGHLNGAKLIAISPTSIITPAARDYLRERGIAIKRATQQATAHARHELAAVLFGEAATAFDPSALLADLGRQQVHVERLARTGLVQVVDELADGVARGGACGVLLTDEAAAALCLANRHRGVRACLATSREAIARAKQTIAANLLVVAPEGRGFWELRQLVREFIAAGPGQWVAAYQQRLA